MTEVDVDWLNWLSLPGENKPLYTAIVDGGTVGLNGRGATGTYGSWVIAENGQATYGEQRIPLAGTTNNEAECRIVLVCLDAIEKRGLRGVEITSDSEWTVKAVSGEYKKLKAAHLIPLVKEIRERLAANNARLVWLGKYEHGGAYQLLGH